MFDPKQVLFKLRTDFKRHAQTNASCLHAEFNSLFPACKKSPAKTSLLWTESATTRAIVNAKWVLFSFRACWCWLFALYSQLGTKGVRPSLVVDWTWIGTFRLVLHSKLSLPSRCSLHTDAMLSDTNVSAESRLRHVWSLWLCGHTETVECAHRVRVCTVPVKIRYCTVAVRCGTDTANGDARHPTLRSQLILFFLFAASDRASFDKRSKLGKISGYYRNLRPPSSAVNFTPTPRGRWATICANFYLYLVILIDDRVVKSSRSWSILQEINKSCLFFEFFNVLCLSSKFFSKIDRSSF